MARTSLSKTKRFTNTGIICALATCSTVMNNGLYAQESILQQEINRRANDAQTAQTLLLSGDTAYHKKDYETAVGDYSKAFKLLPNGTLNTELRSAAADRYATAATERSRRLMKFGHYDQAKTLLEEVLNPAVAPHHLGAKKLRAQADDSIRYNPALTPNHVDNVVKVGQLLREGNAFYDLAQFDRAHEAFTSVLNVDPYNKAARRGLEKVNTAQIDYYKTAQDQTRAALLRDVQKQWELPTPMLNTELLEATNGIIQEKKLTDSLASKLTSTIVENIDLDQASLEEAVDFVRSQSRFDNNAGEQDPVNIITNLSSAEDSVSKAIKEARVTIQSSNLPISTLLDYITEQTATKWDNDGTAVRIFPLNSSNQTLISKTFRVPPNFLAATAAAAEDPAASIFSDSNNSSEGKLTKRISAQDFLKQSGISFPDGATINYIPQSNTLTVKNTAQNIERIDMIVSAIASEEPLQIITKTTIIRVSETKLKELGFDWLLTPIDLGTAILGGGTVGIGTAIDNIAATATNSSPLSAGLRTGSGAALNNALDSFLSSENSNFGNTQTRAPAILSLTHVVGPGQIQLIMRGLNQSKAADIMVQPSIVSSSGVQASVRSTRELIYPTVYEPPELPNTINSNNASFTITNNILTALQTSSLAAPITPSHPTGFQTREVGVKLDVLADVDSDKNYINLSLTPELTEFEGFVNYGSTINGTSNIVNALGGSTTFVTELTENRILMPIFKKISTGNISTKVQNGATIVLGGLITSRKAKVEDKIPLLGDIPIAGRLFRGEASNTFNEAVIILVNCELVDPTGNP